MILRPSVAAAWHAFSEPLEGRVHSMYLDVLGLVTTGVGNLIDTPEEAARLPWVREDTQAPASRAEIVAAWQDLKRRQDLRKLHWRYAAAQNDLRLTDAAIDALCAAKLASNAAYVQRHHFRDFAEWPADAQLACMSMAWAVGPAFPRKFPRWSGFAEQQDWVRAKACCTIRTIGNPGVVPRNRANELCHDNAATVSEHGLDRSVLHWPALLIAPTTITP